MLHLVSPSCQHPPACIHSFHLVDFQNVAAIVHHSFISTYMPPFSFFVDILFTLIFLQPLCYPDYFLHLFGKLRFWFCSSQVCLFSHATHLLTALPFLSTTVQYVLPWLPAVLIPQPFHFHDRVFSLQHVCVLYKRLSMLHCIGVV